MYRRSRKGCNVNVIHRITSETIRLSKMELKPDNKPKNSEISSLQQSRKNPSGSFQITSVCLTGKFDTGEDSADDLDESRTDDISRLDNETPSFSEDTSYSRDGDDCYLSSPNKPVPLSTPSAPITTTTTTTNASSNTPVSTMYTTLVTSPASTTIGRTVGERFKVVKMESVTPFTRGRWTCLDYVDHSKHTPPDGWVYYEDKYVKLTEVQAKLRAQAQAQAISVRSAQSTAIFPAPPFTNPPNYTPDPGTAYQRQLSAPAACANYSPTVYPNQQFIYNNPPQQFMSTQSAPLQWQYAPQMWMPPLLNMQPPMPMQMMNYQLPMASPQELQPVAPAQQYIQGPVQPQQQQYCVQQPAPYIPQQIQEGNQPGTAVLLQQTTHQQLLFINQADAGVQQQNPPLQIEEIMQTQEASTEVRTDTLRTSSMPPTPTTTPVEFGEKVQKRKSSSPGIEETSYGPTVKVMATADATVKEESDGITFALDRPIKVEPIELTSPEDETYEDYMNMTVCTSELIIKDEFDDYACEQPDINEVVEPESAIDAPEAAESSNFTCDDDSASGASTAAIDSKIEQAMDLVKDHLLYTIRGEVDVLKERIAELMDRINQLEIENSFLRENASPEVLCALKNGAALQKGAASSK